MIKGIKLQLYPNREQEAALFQMFENSRFIWNTMLGMVEERYKNNPNLKTLNNFALNNLLPCLKQEYPDLKKSDSSSLQIDNENLAKAWRSFFTNPKFFRKPRFKSPKYPKQSYTGKSRLTVLKRRYIQIPKLGVVKCSDTRQIEGKIKRYTVSCNRGKYYLSLQVEVPDRLPLPKTGANIGIALSGVELAVLSDGTVLENFKNKYHKQGRYEDKAANRHKDYLHKLTTRIVRDYDVIVMEDFKTIKENPRLNNPSWQLFKSMLTYKCLWAGKQLILIAPLHSNQARLEGAYDLNEIAIRVLKRGMAKMN